MDYKTNNTSTGMKKACSAVLAVTLLLGPKYCWALNRDHTYSHTQRHIVSVTLSQQAASVVRNASLTHEEAGDHLVLALKGTVGRPWKRENVKAFITARFTDKEGEVIFKEFKEISLGTDSHGSQEDTFSIKVEDDPKIVRCNLDLEWEKPRI